MSPGLRVLLVTQSYHPVYGGIGEHVRHLGLALVSRGHSVRVLTSGPPPRGGELPGLEVARIGRRFRIPSNGARANLAFHPDYRRAVRRVLAEGRFDLVHLHSPLEPFLPWAVLLETRAPIVGTFHNAGPAHWGYRFFGRALAPLADRITIRTAVSKSAAVFASRFFPGEFHVIPNGVDIERFSPNGPRPPGRRAPSILFVGSLEQRKGLDVLITAVALLRDRLDPPPRLTIVGDGSLRRRILRDARRARIDLTWLGTVAHDEIPNCYRAADVLVAPAIYGESFGIVLLEALASGIPVVASRIEGFAEVLEGCRSARLVQPGDARALASAIEYFTMDNEDPSLPFEACRHAQIFAWSGVAGRIEALYHRALGGTSAHLPGNETPGPPVRSNTADLTWVEARVTSPRS